MTEKPFSSASGASNEILIGRILDDTARGFGGIVDMYRGRLYIAVQQAILDGKSGWKAAELTLERIRERQSSYRKSRNRQKKVYGVQYGAKRHRAKHVHQD